MNTKNIRIKDIAQLAGVSVGTVDRVLHNRGRVSDDALKKVLSVLDQIDYKPNLIARTLGANKTYRIAALVPNPDQDPYWASSKSGISQAEAEWLRYSGSVFSEQKVGLARHPRPIVQRSKVNVPNHILISLGGREMRIP